METLKLLVTDLRHQYNKLTFIIANIMLHYIYINVSLVHEMT